MKNKAQAISEYVLLIVVCATALSFMHLYFQRSVRAVIKIAADEVGEQKLGATASDYLEWRDKEDSETYTTSAGVNTEVKLAGAAVIYGKNETTLQEGIGSYGTWQVQE